MADPRTVSPEASPSVGGSSIHPNVDNMSATAGVVTVEEVEKQTERLLSLFKNRKVCVLYDERKWQLAAEKIWTWFKDRGVNISQLKYTEPGWIETVKQANFTNFVFLGLPSCDRRRKGALRLMRPARSPTASDYSQMEYSYFTPRIINEGNVNLNVNDIVVVMRESINTKKDHKQKISGHYLESYMVLDGEKHPSVIAASALGVFAAPTPIPLSTDKAFWSKSPKLITDFRPKSDVSLGLVIMTREMAEGAPFNRIVLVSSVSSDDHHYEFFSKVGRYTHIQSINGILLDGLKIEKVTEIFKHLPYCYIQFMVRYVHLDESQGSKFASQTPSDDPAYSLPPAKELPKRQSTMSVIPDSGSGAGKSSKQHRAAQNDIPILPIPLFILGDNYQLCKELFLSLSDNVASSPAGSRPPRLSRDQNTGGSVHGTSLANSPSHPPPPLTRRSVSVPGPPPYDSTERRRHDMDMDIVEEPDSETSVRLRSSSFKGISASDRYMTRCEMPLSKLENLPSTSKTENVRPSNTTPTTPTAGYNHRDNLLMSHKLQYILHLPNQELDRQTTHLYFKTSGIYLVVVNLEDHLENQLIQYENLFYWINMVHTYVTPELKRLFVVGMYNRSSVTSKNVFDSIKVLNNLLKQHRQAVRIPLEEEGYIYLYDREASEEECKYLCSSIVNCSTLFYDSSFYFAEDVYKSMFDPFSGFLRLATELSLNHDHTIMESKYTIGQRFKRLYGNHQHLHLPKGYFETLTAYSPVCISKHCDACLLKPSVIPDLLHALSLLTEYETQIFDLDPVLFNLPVVSVQMLRRCFEHIQPKGKDFDMILWWMLDLSLIYSIGSLRDDEKFFVPYLLHYHLSDRKTYIWDDDRIDQMFKNPTVLYAQFSLRVPLTLHLFHKVLAQFLLSVLRENIHEDVFIHPDLPEAVLPLFDDFEFICSTWIRYRAMQNIIEFRAKVTNRIRFLKAVENKLSKSYLNTRYYNKAMDFNRVVTFRIPSTTKLSKKTVQPPELLELLQLEKSPEDEEEMLVSTTHLTEPGNRKKTAVMRQWADKDPEAKELPAELTLKISERLAINDDWARLGSRLGVLNSDDINIRRARPTSNHGNYVLQKWTDSNRSFGDLIKGLNELHLESLASAVEAVVYGETDNSGAYVPDSKLMEKKLPSDFFLELSKVLNIDDKWAMVGSILKLLTTSEIENLRANQLVDKGAHVLQLWTDSHLTYQDLINALNDKWVRLDRYVPVVQSLIKNHLSSS